MSYVKYCDCCGDEMVQEQKIGFKGKNGHFLSISVHVSSEAGIREFHICKWCMLSKIRGDEE